MPETQRAIESEPREAVEVTQFDDVREAWKCPHLSAALGGPGEEYFHEGTVMRLDGREHLLRRRTMGLLLKRRGHQQFRDRWLFPTADAALADLLKSPDADGYARVDLLRWAQRVNQQLAAALVGFDEATTADGADELFAMMEVTMAGRPGAFQIVMGGYDAESEAARKAIAMKGTIIDRFYEGPLKRRQELVRQLEASEIEESDLPQDLLMLIARKTDPAWEDPELARREALFLLSAGVHTTASSMIWTLREIFQWLEEHPGEAHRLDDEKFVLRLAHEALRLHPVVPGFPRMATEDVTLKHDGLEVPEGAIAVIRSGPASRDRDVYGADADVFNPDREVPPGVYPHGFAFGTGPHMCYGMPIVMGSEGLDGSLVYLLKIVLAAGVRADPDKLPAPVAPTRGAFSAPHGGLSVIFAGAS